ADREAAADTILHEHLAVSRGDLLERTIAPIVVQQPALAVPRRRTPARDVELRVDVPVDDDQVEQGIVVVVQELRAPPDVRQAARRGPRSERRVRESIAVRVIERVVFLAEVGDGTAPTSGAP